MTFTKDQMIDALIRVGYEVILEEVVEEVEYSIYTEKVSRSVHSVYYKGNKLNDVVYKPYGLNVVQFVFDQELKKRVLGLF